MTTPLSSHNTGSYHRSHNLDYSESNLRDAIANLSVGGLSIGGVNLPSTNGNGAVSGAIDQVHVGGLFGG